MYLEDLKSMVEDNTYKFETTPNPFVKKKNFKDGHPDVYLHYEIAKDVAQKLDIDFKIDEIQEKIEYIHKEIQQIKHLADIWNGPITL
jgi:hypothetical protein